MLTATQSANGRTNPANLPQFETPMMNMWCIQTKTSNKAAPRFKASPINKPLTIPNITRFR